MPLVPEIGYVRCRSSEMTGRGRWDARNEIFRCVILCPKSRAIVAIRGNGPCMSNTGATSVRDATERKVASTPTDKSLR